MKWQQFWALSAALILSGCTSTQCIIFCHNETEIQADYVIARDDCQNLAQDVVPKRGDSKQYNSELLFAFAKCMKDKGWGVTSPKKTTVVAGGPNDNSNLSGNPWDPSPYGAAAQSSQQAQSIQAQRGYDPYPAQQQPYGQPPQSQQAQPFNDGYSPYPADAYGQQQTYGQQSPYGQNQPYSQQQPYGQTQAYGQSNPYGQTQANGQPQQSYGQPAYGQSDPYGQQQGYGQTQSYPLQQPLQQQAPNYGNEANGYYGQPSAQPSYNEQRLQPYIDHDYSQPASTLPQFQPQQGYSPYAIRGYGTPSPYSDDSSIYGGPENSNRAGIGLAPGY